MTTNEALTSNNLVDAAVDWLGQRVPQDWVVALSTRSPAASDLNRADAAIDIRSPGMSATLAVEARTKFGPRDVDRLLPGVGRVLRDLSPYIPILVVAPWLSTRTQERLAEENLNYIDLTGNARLRLDNPPMFIETQGARRDPNPAARGATRLRGPKAARLIRLLLDVRPPYTVTALAQAARLNPGYVSRLLETMNQEALIERSARGEVLWVDIQRLIRRWAEVYSVFETNRTETFLASRGPAAALEDLGTTQLSGRRAVTGSFVAASIAPVAAPSLLAIYTDDVPSVVEALDLLPTDRGANVAMLTPFDPVVWERNQPLRDGVNSVAVTQAVVDCLTGNGRMPAEGEALMEWMVDNESKWRADSLPSGALEA
jgi:hypothetical protein